MLFSSTVSLALSKSKRIITRLLSTAETGFTYYTEKSPLKKDIKLSLMKHDPIANKHVLFTEQRSTGGSGNKRKPIRQSTARFARLTGVKIGLLVNRLEKKK
jgi:large subunit ribosomal protein L33